MTVTQKLASGWLGLLWTLATVVGAFIGTFIGVQLFPPRGDPAGQNALTFAFYTLLATSVGALQALLFRKEIPFAVGWLLASMFAGVASGIVAAVAGDLSDLILGFGGFGALLGIMQWFVLRQQIARAWWWLLASPLGWGWGLVIARLVDRVIVFTETTGLIAGLVIIAGVAGIITGAVLAWLSPRMAKPPVRSSR